MSERTARRVISALVEKRLLVSESHKATLGLDSQSTSLNAGSRGCIRSHDDDARVSGVELAAKTSLRSKLSDFSCQARAGSFC